jgi:trk system potassium uptake protein TrkH
MIGARFVGQVVGLLCLVLGTLMLVPAIFEIADDEPEWRVFLVSALGCGYVGVSLFLALRSPLPAAISMREAFLLTFGCWIAVSLLAAVPFMGVGMSFTDAVFESVAGLTTTGATVMTGLDTSSYGILLWRSLLQWIGGIGIVSMAMLLMPFLRIGGMHLFITESSDRSAKVFAKVRDLVTRIFAIYVILTAACAVLYWYFGMTLFDAVNHAMTTVATAGFSTHDASFGYFRDPALHWIAIAFMLAGAMPFVCYVQMLGGDLRALWRHPEVRMLLVLVGLLSLAMAAWLSARQDISYGAALTKTAFNITSIVTTTGFVSEDYSRWGGELLGLFLILMLVGGCSGSTTGALKLLRFQILWIDAQAHMARLVSPSRVMPRIYQGRPLRDDVVHSVLVFISLYFALTLLLIAGFAATGLDFISAVSTAVSAIGNVGPGLGATVGPDANFSALTDSAKWLMAFAMLLGRLELFTVLVLLVPAFWR